MAEQKTANIRQVLTRRCAGLGIPVSGTFELTPRCNLQCKMCYIRLTPAEMAAVGRELTAEEWLKLAKDAREAGMTFLLITGGEPTLRRDFCEIYEALAQMGFSISINTNGTLLTPELRALWHRLPPAQVNVTLYGVSREDYQNLCSNPDAFDAVIDGVNWLRSEGILVHLNTTMTPFNRAHWQELEALAKSLSTELRMTTYCFPPVRRESCGVCGEFSRLSPKEAAGLAVRDFWYREGTEAVRKRVAELDRVPQNSCMLDEGEPIQCMAGRSQFWIAWDGRMSPCGMLDQPAAHTFDGGSFAQCWEALKEETRKIRLCPDCAACEQRFTCLNCAAVTYAETGRFDGKPEYMCQYNEAYRAALLEIAQSTE